MLLLNDANLEDFTEALRYTDQAFSRPSPDQFDLLDRVNENCRLAREMVAAMAELTARDLTDAYKRAFEHYKAIVALWLLLNDRELLKGDHNPHKSEVWL